MSFGKKKSFSSTLYVTPSSWLTENKLPPLKTNRLILFREIVGVDHKNCKEIYAVRVNCSVFKRYSR
jgi:hypothetical protein